MIITVTVIVIVIVIIAYLKLPKLICVLHFYFFDALWPFLVMSFAHLMFLFFFFSLAFGDSCSLDLRHGYLISLIASCHVMAFLVLPLLVCNCV
ncbi:hypothetical protein F4678DRAFT_438766 [Xylaria arbuscula]|nr:hypothetical protein F4678DRAFT_438766 [Xylaria arbuscula]